MFGLKKTAPPTPKDSWSLSDPGSSRVAMMGISNETLRGYMDPGASNTTAVRRPQTGNYGTYAPPPNISDESYRMHMLHMRLRTRDGANAGVEHISTALSGDKVFIFIVQGGEAVTLEDGQALFPSDALITQIRLLQK